MKQQMIEWLGPIIVEYYGATEGNGFTFCTRRSGWPIRGTVGKAILGELADPRRGRQRSARPARRARSGSGAPPTSSTSTTRPRRRSRAIDDGNTSTVGDVGYLDDDGYLYLTDRKTYMIISGGVNIYPQETENLLITHPKVVDAAVIGVPNEDLGEEVKGVVQPIAGRGGRAGARARADRVLPRAPGPLQVPADDRLRGRAAAPADREAVQASATRPLLGGAPLASADVAVDVPAEVLQARVDLDRDHAAGRPYAACELEGGSDVRPS